MSQRKWIYILLFGGLFFIGMPNAANCDEENPSSVKDCRVHIEKALEQYWDAKEPSERTNVKHEALTTSDELDTNEQPNLAEVDSEDDDDEDLAQVEEGGEKQVTKDGNEEADEDDDDENETDDTEDDDDNDPDEKPTEKSETEDAEDEDDDEDETTNNVQQDSVETDDKVKAGDGERAESADDDDDEEDDDGDKDSEIKTEDGKGDDDDDDEKDDNDEEKNDDEGENSDEKDDGEGIAEVENESKNIDVKTEEVKVESSDVDVKTEDVKVESSDVDVKTEEAKDDDKVKDVDALKDEVRPSEETVVVVSKEEIAESKPESSETLKESTQVAPEKAIEEKSPSPATDSLSDEEDNESEIENIYEEEDEEGGERVEGKRSREHIPLILDLEGKGPEWEQEEAKLAQTVFKEIRKIETTSIRPMELLYKYTDSTTRVLGDAELFNKPMLLFLGPWNSGKTSVINYILGIENTPQALKTGTGITDTDFTIITSGDRQRVVSGTELAADWKYAGTQKFGQGFLDHFRSIHIQNPLLEKVILIDTPGILENRKHAERGYPFSDVFQWFIDRADAIYVVLDPSKVDIGAELGGIVEELKGRDARFVLNKADTIRRSDLMRVVGQLFWNLSPLMASTEAPLIYAVSMTSRPFLPTAPAKFLADQEKNFFYDMKATLEKHVENKILYARKHAVRVRNHAKMVDCFLATYYRHKSIFSNKRNVAKQITENPQGYNIFDGYGSVKNISRFDLPSPQTYKEFFKVHPLYDFKPLASTCSYFRGCPMDKLDQAITKDIPELLAKYQKMKSEITGEVKR